jgi:hypothetical protein
MFVINSSSRYFKKSESKKCWVWEFEKETRIKESLGFMKESAV